MSLSKEEQLILETLVDPEVQAAEQYKLDQDIQRHIIGMLLTDRAFLLQSMDLVSPLYFTSEVHQQICRILFKHFNKYSVLPHKFYVVQALKDLLVDREPAIQTYYLGELNTTYDYYIPGIESRDFLLDRITNFAKIQAIKAAFSKSLDLLKKDAESEETWFKIDTLLQQARSVDRRFEVGLEYFQNPEERYLRMMAAIAAGDYFPTGFPTIDNALGNGNGSGGMCRGEIGAFMGLSGSGKSRILASIAVKNLEFNKRVLYVSLEMSEDDIAERFDAALADTAKLHDVTINNLVAKKDIVIQALKGFVSDKEDPRMLVIKQFPAGSLDVSSFRAYYTQLLIYGFRPDLVIVDYVGEMKDFPGLATHESRPRIVKELRGFASENNVCVLTAIQANAKGKEMLKEVEGVLDESAQAEAFGQTRPMDAFWTINQTKEEALADLGRIYAEKHRSAKAKMVLYTSYDPATLQIKEISENEYNIRLKEQRHKMAEKAKEHDMDKDLKEVQHLNIE